MAEKKPMTDPTVAEKLKQLWLILNETVEVEIREKWWNTIEEKYSSRNNHFHNFDNLARMFIHLNQSEEKISSAKAVSYAIFFYQLECDPNSVDNHKKNCELFKEFATDAKMDKESAIYKKVLNLIELTESHLTDEHMSHDKFGTEDQHYFLDFDLSYSGSSVDEYQTSVKAIREEYKFMNDEDYSKLRIKTLKALLQMPKIYSTQLFYDNYEKIARDNISLEIAGLESKLKTKC